MDRATEIEGEVMALFKLRLQPNVDNDELMRLWNRMHEIATTTPEIGLLGAESWSSPDGPRMVAYRFPSKRGLDTFVRHPEHLAAMRRGAEFFTSIHTQICPVLRERQTSFDAVASPDDIDLEKR